MQPKSISESVPVEHEHSTNPSFPRSGDNFSTVACLDGIDDPQAFLEALALVRDYQVALGAFENIR